MTFDQGVDIVPVVDLGVVQKIFMKLDAELVGEVGVEAVAEVVEKRHTCEKPGWFDEVGEFRAVVGDAFGAEDCAAVLAAPIALDDVADDVFRRTHGNPKTESRNPNEG